MVKITKMAEIATVVTHGGIFHADEVLATAILTRALGEITVLRAFKVPEGLGKEVIVYDLGGGSYDHHQKGGNGSRENGVPYASAGLIWKKFGPKIVEAAGACNPEWVWYTIDSELIQGVDAVDNGAAPTLNYPTQVMSINRIVSGFNPSWDSAEDPDTAFLKAVELVSVIFDNTLASALSKAKAQSIVEEAIANAQEHIMVLERFVPWQEFLLSCSSKAATDVEFVIFPSNRGGFNWQCVPDRIGGFGQRKPVPAEWKGLSGDSLQNLTGVQTATFCHSAGFIGGASTFEGAYALAKIAAEA